ncbi:MAG TPA: hypothetical protein VGO37_12225 [Steroidobacteraceae bacterium]|nr:hypothetical protein [Steroidobacteraceae bacterium]
MLGAAIGATAATAASLVTMLAIPGVGAGSHSSDWALISIAN